VYVRRPDGRVEDFCVSGGDLVQHHLSRNAVSPDGKSVAISTNAREAGDVDVAIVDAKTGEIAELTTHQGEMQNVPAGWLADGRLLAITDRDSDFLHLEAIDIHDSATGETVRLDSGGLFVFIGADADTAWLPAEIALDQRGYVLTGPDVRAAERWELDRDPYLLETSVPGIFACGDVRFSPVKRVAAAVGEGSMAIAFVHQYLKDSSSHLEAAVAARPGA